MERSSRNRTRTMVLTALLTALALVLGYMERLLPLDFAIPGVKVGLANVVVVTGLYLFRLPLAFGIALLKSATTFLINGSVIGFCYGLTGTLCSFAGMALLKCLFKEEISPVSVSVVGGMLHMVGQIGAAVLVTQTPALFGYLPVLLIAGAVAGTLVGFTVKGTWRYMRRWSI